MRNLPLPIRWILNLIFFILYYFILLFLTGFALGLILEIIWIGADAITDSMSEMLALIGIPVTCITIYFRDKFYLLAQKSEEKIPETVPQESVTIETSKR